MMNYKNSIVKHYIKVWSNEFKECKWVKGPIHELPPEFSVLEFRPFRQRKMWTYATCCMSQPHDENKIELFMFFSVPSETIVEILYAIAHYHRNGNSIGLGNTINFGKGIVEGSTCEYGLISLPYLDGPELEIMRSKVKDAIHFYWIIPITKNEVEYKKKYGLEAIEQKFDETEVNYLDPYRTEVV